MLYISEKPFSYILKLDILDYIAVYICWDMNLKMNVDNFCIFFFGVQGIGLQAKYLFLLKLTPFFGTTMSRTRFL